MDHSIYGKYEEYLPKIMNKLASAIWDYNSEYRRKYDESAYEHLSYRIKEEESMREKCRRQDLPETPESALFLIQDAVGLRIVCNFIDDIYGIVEHIRSLDGVKIVKEKDYIKNVKPNGYRSLHLILELTVPYEDVHGNNPGTYFAEIQLRTIAMDSWAALEHQVKYKKNLEGINLELITSELKRCADELASCDLSMQAIRNMVREKTGENT